MDRHDADDRSEGGIKTTLPSPSAHETPPRSAGVNCPDCWKGKPLPCAVGCRDTNECCDKRLDVLCERCGGTGVLGLDGGGVPAHGGATAPSPPEVYEPFEDSP